MLTNALKLRMAAICIKETDDKELGKLFRGIALFFLDENAEVTEDAKQWAKEFIKASEDYSFSLGVIDG